MGYKNASPGIYKQILEVNLALDFLDYCTQNLQQDLKNTCNRKR